MPVSTVYEQKSIPPWLAKHLENLSAEAKALTPSGLVNLEDMPQNPLPANATPAQRQARENHIKKLREEAQQQLQQAYPTYPIGRRLAEASAETKRANELIRQRLQNPEYTQQLNTAEESLMRGMNPNFQQEVQTYMNPYMQSVLNRIREEGTRTFTENILPALQSKFTSLGRHGGGKHRAMVERASRSLQNEILSRQEQALSQGYWNAANLQNAQTSRLMQGAGQLAQMVPLRNALRVGDISALKDVGREAEARNQEQLNLEYQDFIRQRELPLQMLRERANLTQGIGQHVPGSSMYSNYMPAPSHTNAAGNLSQIAASLYGASAAQPRPAVNPGINPGDIVHSIGTFGGALNPIFSALGIRGRGRDEHGFPLGDVR